MKQGVATHQSTMRTAGPYDELGDEAFGELVERWRGALVGLMRSWRAPDPVELAQDVLAEAWLGRRRFRGELRDEHIGPWLRGIAWNLCAAAARGRRRRREQELPDGVLADEAAADAVDDRHADVRRAIERLPDDLRSAVWMHYLERTPVARVAALLDVTAKTIEGRLYRARKALARLLDRRDAAARSER